MKTLSKFFFIATFVCVAISINGQTWTPNGSNLYVNPINAKVGIGVSNPLSKLHVNASYLQTPFVIQEGGVNRLVVDAGGNSGNVTIGANGSTNNGLYVNGLIQGNSTIATHLAKNKNFAIASWEVGGPGSMSLMTFNDAESEHIPMSFVASRFYFYSGSVGIGVINIPSNSKLAVDGKIVCEEIEVKNVSADFVFDVNYKLPSLKEVELFIKTNGHLPGVAPASETEKGVNLGEFNQILLQKIEELTLYMIDLKKENEELKSKVALLLE
ncbi:MAG: hypothetical protein RBS07_16290 [Lentimicrobium sp.]|nr:hypothetical protein [Lentimicrobium sp.]